MPESAEIPDNWTTVEEVEAVAKEIDMPAVHRISLIRRLRQIVLDRKIEESERLANIAAGG